MDNIYTLKKVCKTYSNYISDTKALDSISVDIKIGTINVVLGPSGSGKSTLLNVLSGIDKVTSGNVLFEGININNYDDVELTLYRRDNLGFIFQSYNLISNLTVKENIELGSNLGKFTIDLDEMIKLVGLEEHKNKYPYQLSGGQMQRVAIARALVKNPKVLFCDEPTGALDEKMGKKILTILKEINEKYGTTLIIVTHNPSIALMANMVIKMNSGKIVDVKYNKELVDVNDLRWS